MKAMSRSKAERSRPAVANEEGSSRRRGGSSRASELSEALSDVDKGKTVPAGDVEAWIESWDTPSELPTPKPRPK